MRMIKSGKFNDKKILLIEKEPKTKNDRTWCFWEQENGLFQDIVFKEWETISVKSEKYGPDLPIHPYKYKMIRGIDFYDHCFTEILQHHNIEVCYANLGDIKVDGHKVDLVLDKKLYTLHAAIVFNSFYRPAPPAIGDIRLLQHFKGWMIETAIPAFDPAVATIMDFRVPQPEGTTFAYILPFSSTKALIEYTLFTPELLEKNEYDKRLTFYIEKVLNIRNYKKVEEETGIIPMTNEKFIFEGQGWMIGTAGGQTKSSSGYTFQFIQKHAQEITDLLIRKKSLRKLKPQPSRFSFYDNTLLEILYHNKVPGKQIFTRLFIKNKPQQVLRFLDNESTVRDELKIISSLPVWPFFKAAMKQI